LSTVVLGNTLPSRYCAAGCSGYGIAFQPYSAGAVTKPTAAAPATQTVIEQKELNFGQ
jgi:hypothetical protein